ncbi:MAG TPA: hypothetical protein VLV78_13920 [Thermoanaerobaculia bacterium]|nr:hypothetical protein [Thermoanaerobaculia bacterium]
MSGTIATPQSAKIAAKYARLPEVKGLFEELSRRYETLSAMQMEFVKAIKRNRAAREGKPVKISKRGKRILGAFDRDAAQATQEIERLSQGMDDRALLTSELSSIQQMIEFDERMLSAWHPDDKPLAQAIINYQRETLKLIEDFVQNSSFKGQVTSAWKGKAHART